MTLGPESDETLLEHLRHNSEAALQELFRRYFTRLTEFAYSIVRRRDLAEEAALNVYLSLWRRRSSFTTTTRLRSYLFAAVGNQALTLRRVHLSDVPTNIDDAPSGALVDDAHPKDNLVYEEFRREVDELIMQLPPQRQLIFRMSRLEGLSYAAIAEALELSPRTVQNQMIIAIRQLEPHLDVFLKAFQSDRY